MLTEKHIRAMGLRPLLHTPDGLWIVEADYPDQIELSEIISIEDNLDESEALIRKYIREVKLDESVAELRRAWQALAKDPKVQALIRRTHPPKDGE